MNDLIDPRIQAHANLQRAITQHEGRRQTMEYDGGLQQHRSGTILNDASIFTEILVYSAIFATPAAILSFLKGAREVTLKWMELKQNRSIKLKTETYEVEITGSADIDQAIKAIDLLQQNEK